MARRKSNKAGAGGGIVILLAGVGYGIYNWVVGHKEIVIIVAIAIIAFIVLLIVAKRIRIQKYWKWYFSRERGLEELGTQYLLQEETNDALNKRSQSIDGCLNTKYKEMCSAVKRAYNSDEIVWLEGNNVKYRNAKSLYLGENLIDSLNIRADGDVATVYCKTNEDGGYSFVLLPNAIYAFITGDNAFTFVGAYEKSALRLNTDHMHYSKTYTNITDMSHQPRGYFLRYCDIHDSRAAAAGWQYETKDGYRDGRRQGNNYFIVKFIYSRADFAFGNMTSRAAFSCTDSGDLMSSELATYKKMRISKAPAPKVTNRKTDDDILAAVTQERPQIQTSNTGKKERIEQTTREALIKSGSISCDEARSRNRDIAKSLQGRLSKEFSDLEFKIFQIKKQREDRDLQDASVYTYLRDGASRYCLEYNIKTNLDSGATVLEYILTADDDNVLQGEICQNLIRQNQMKKVGSSYRTVLEVDYSKDCSDDPITHMFNTIRSYVNMAIGSKS